MLNEFWLFSLIRDFDQYFVHNSDISYVDSSAVGVVVAVIVRLITIL